MAENTEVGPAGSTGPALGSKKPANHTPTEQGGGFSQGKGADGSSATLGKTGELKPVHGDS